VIPERCPKCERARRPGEEACAQCGLLVARWASYSDEPPEHPALDPAWSALEASWQDEAAHARFLDLAATSGGLDLAAARYRAARRRRPGDPVAEAGLKRALTLAEHLHVAAAQGERRPTGVLLRVLGFGLTALVFLAALWLGVLLIRRR
jgi:hypothetical protein